MEHLRLPDEVEILQLGQEMASDFLMTNQRQISFLLVLRLVSNILRLAPSMKMGK